MPRTKASAKRATGEDDEAKEDSGPKEDAPTAKNDAPTPSKMKKKKTSRGYAIHSEDRTDNDFNDLIVDIIR